MWWEKNKWCRWETLDMCILFTHIQIHTSQSLWVIHYLSILVCNTHHIKNSRRYELGEGIQGHELEDTEHGCQGSSSLHDDLGYTGDVGDLGSEWSSHTGLCLWQRDACMGCLQCLGTRDIQNMLHHMQALTPQSLAPSPHILTPYLGVIWYGGIIIYISTIEIIYTLNFEALQPVEPFGQATSWQILFLWQATERWNVSSIEILL